MHQSRLEEPGRSIADSTARGRAARKSVPRSSHAAYDEPADRRDPVSVLEEQAVSRLPELLPIRHGRMAASPFAFFRGAAAVMAMDLARTPVSGMTVQLCGDAHLANFGVYNSPDRRLVFDLNDFDETLPGPWEWDVKRLATSLVIAAQANGLDEGAAVDVATGCVRTYRTAMGSFAAMTNLQVWYSRFEVESALEALRARASAGQVKRLRQATARYASRDNLQAFSRLTEEVDGERRFRSEPPLVQPLRELLPETEAEELLAGAQLLIADYLRSLEDDRRRLVSTYRFADLARKVVGVGSVGTRAWVVLMLGRDGADPLVLQIKEAQRSVLEAHLGASEFERAGHRVVAGQRLMQAASDIFLGWYRGIGIDGVERDFYVRQLRDGKGSVDVADLDADGLRSYGELCGWTLARAHARSGDRVAIASYLGSGHVFDDAVATFALAYAEQNARDHAALVAAVASGRVEAVADV